MGEKSYIDMTRDERWDRIEQKEPKRIVPFSEAEFPLFDYGSDEFFHDMDSLTDWMRDHDITTVRLQFAQQMIPHFDSWDYLGDYIHEDNFHDIDSKEYNELTDHVNKWIDEHKDVFAWETMRKYTTYTIEAPE